MNYDEEIAALKANQSGIYHQLNEIKIDIKDLSKLTIAVEKLANSMQPMNEKIGSIDKRLYSIERKPAENYEHYKKVIIGCILTGVIGIILGALLALIIK